MTSHLWYNSEFNVVFMCSDVVCMSPEPCEDVVWTQTTALQFPGLLTQAPCAECG